MTNPPEREAYGAPAIAIGWMLLTGLMFVAVTGIVRYVGSDVPAAEAAFIRYVIGLGLILPFMWRHIIGGMERRILATYSLRGLCHALGVILWFYAMARIPIAEVTAIGYTSPQFISNIERGWASIPPQKIAKLAKVLEIGSNEIVEAMVDDYRAELWRIYDKSKRGRE